MGAAGNATPILNAHGHGAAVYRPEDSVYYHPQLNPEGKPPPGKPQRYRSVPQLAAAPRAPGDHSERLESDQTHVGGALQLFCHWCYCLVVLDSQRNNVQPACRCKLVAYVNR